MSGLPPPSLALSPSSPRVIASGLREGKRSRHGPDRVGGHAMAKQGFRIADSDMHVLEPADLWLNIEQTGKRFDRGIMGHVVSHSLEMMQACVSMCMGGVLERHPG